MPRDDHVRTSRKELMRTSISTILFVTSLLVACGDDGTGGAGETGGAGGTGGGGTGATGGTGGAGGVPAGYFVCGDETESTTYCEDGVEYCVEQYSDGPSVTTCHPIPTDCSTLTDEAWCDCALTEIDEPCAVVVCTTEEYVACDG